MFTYIYPPQSVSVAVPPSEFILDGANQTVTQDTVNPVNNRAMPSLNFFYEGADQVPAIYDPSNSTYKGIPSTVLFELDGLVSPVKKDTPNPGNSIGLPVELVGNSGVRFVLDGVTTEVTEDTVTPTASIPLPTKLLDASGNIVSPLTDAELRATPVPVSGPLTDAELRASAVPVSAASLPLPTGAATETTLSSIDTKTPTLVGGRVPVDGSGVTQPISAASLPLPTGAATESTLSAVNGKLPATLGQLGEAASFSVALATEHEALLNDIKSNTAAKVINSMSQSTTTTSATLTAPAGAKGFTIQNSTRASGALRFTQSGGGASATVGFLLEPGQSTSYQDGASSLSVFAVDGTAIDACVIWYV